MSLPVNLSYQSYGSGEPLIILHGLLGSKSNWSTTSEILGKKLKVFSLDLRNHGNSPRSNQFDYFAMVDDLKKFMDDHKLNSAHILGHSLGGKIAMMFSDIFPWMVDKMIIVDIAPKAYPPYHKDIIDAMIELDLSQYSTYKSVVEALSPKIPPLQFRYFLAKNLIQSPQGKLCWNVNLEAIKINDEKINIDLELKNHFTRPVLFLQGEYSNFIQKKDQENIKKFFPQVKFFKIKGAGHWVHIDAKDLFIKEVLKFILSCTN